MFTLAHSSAHVGEHAHTHTHRDWGIKKNMLYKTVTGEGKIAIACLGLILRSITKDWTDRVNSHSDVRHH